MPSFTQHPWGPPREGLPVTFSYSATNIYSDSRRGRLCLNGDQVPLPSPGRGPPAPAASVALLTWLWREKGRLRDFTAWFLAGETGSSLLVPGLYPWVSERRFLPSPACQWEIGKGNRAPGRATLRGDHTQPRTSHHRALITVATARPVFMAMSGFQPARLASSHLLPGRHLPPSLAWGSC